MKMHQSQQPEFGFLTKKVNSSFTTDGWTLQIVLGNKVLIKTENILNLWIGCPGRFEWWKKREVENLFELSL